MVRSRDSTVALAELKLPLRLAQHLPVIRESILWRQMRLQPNKRSNLMELLEILDGTNQASSLTLPAIARERMDRLKAHTAKVGVIGLGYVGLPLSLLLSGAGFKVTGFDIDKDKVAELEAGRSYIFRIPSKDVQAAREQGLRATTQFSNLADQDVVIMCVPTPLTEHHEPE
jgi:UDP-N-acetyl-D-glucosamine dehydrogenase